MAKKAFSTPTSHGIGGSCEKCTFVFQTTLSSHNFPIHHIKNAHTTQQTNTMPATKSVRFAPAPSTSFSYPRVGAADIENVYYQEEDYRRFKQDSWLESLRLQRQQQRMTALRQEEANKQRSSRRSGMRNFGNNSRGRVQQQGAAQAA